MHRIGTLDTDSTVAGGSGPAVSALVVNYHAYDELEACLASLQRQRIRVEVIVVDQDTREGQRRTLEQKYRDVRWIPQTTNFGFAAGVNLAARHASGSYLYLVNPDAVVAPDAAGALAEWLEQRPHVAVVGSLVLDPNGAIQGSARRFPGISTLFGGRTALLTRLFPGNPLSRRNILSGAHVREPIEVDWVSGASMMIRRRAFQAVGGMDERFFLYWEDADLCRRLRDAGLATVYHPGPAVTHHCGRSGGATSRSIIAFHQSAYWYFRKHTGTLGLVTSPLALVALTLRLGVKLLVRRGGQAQVPN
jgi:N-acetylglucosaminyl-diphospho-decaprenol L-rhamnosyltransferase